MPLMAERFVSIGGDDRSFVKEGINIYLMAPMSSLDLPNFYKTSSHLSSIVPPSKNPLRSKYFVNAWKRCHCEEIMIIIIIQQESLVYRLFCCSLLARRSIRYFWTEILWILRSPHNENSYLITIVAHVHNILDNVLQLLIRERISRGSVGDDCRSSWQLARRPQPASQTAEPRQQNHRRPPSPPSSAPQWRGLKTQIQASRLYASPTHARANYKQPSILCDHFTFEL
jgi:hypothetical protein